MSHFHTILLILHNHNKLYFLYSEEIHFQESTLHFSNFIQPTPTLAVIAASQPPVPFILFPIEQNKAASTRFLNQDLDFLPKAWLVNQNLVVFFTWG